MAISGRVWVMIKTGNRARRSGRKKSMRTEKTNAAVSEEAKPKVVA
jgi:hypothetical protein